MGLEGMGDPEDSGVRGNSVVRGDRRVGGSGDREVMGDWVVRGDRGNLGSGERGFGLQGWVVKKVFLASVHVLGF